MNKRDLTMAIWEENQSIKQGDVATVLDSLFAQLTRAFQKGEKVRLNGLGTFEVKGRAAGTFRNPKTGQTVQKPASRTVRFKAGDALKQAVNG